MRIYTIGYGDKEFEELTELLQEVEVDMVVDVRSFPTSKWPEFEKEKLQNLLEGHGIDYVHLEELGGYRDEGYEEYMSTEEFENGIDQFTELAGERKVALLCLESYPSGCHRRFIAEELVDRGWNVIHLVGKKGRQKIL